MPLRTACSSCGKKLQVRDELAGKKVKCPDCGKVFIAAAAGAGSPSADAAAIKASPAKATAPPPMAKDKVSANPPARKPAPPPIEEPDDDDDEVEDRPVRRGTTSGGSGSGMLLWLVLAGVLLIGGAVGAYFMFFSPSPSPGPIAKKGGTPVVPVKPNQDKTQGEENTARGDENPPPAGSSALADLAPGDSWFFATVSGELLRNKALEAAGFAMGVQTNDTFEKASGVALADLERVSIFSLASFAEASKSKEPPIAIIIQTNKPFDPKRVAPAIKKMMEGKGPGMTTEFPNQQTILIGSPAHLATYHEKKGKAKAAGVLERALAQASVSKGAVVAVVVPPEAAHFGDAALKDAPPLAALAPFLKTKSVLATLDVTDKLKLHTTLFMEDAAAASEAKAAAETMIPVAAGMLQFGKDPQSAALAKAAQQALKDLKFNAQDKDLTIAFEMDMKIVMDAVATGMKAAKTATAAAGNTNNFRQIAFAWHAHQDVNRTLPPQTVGAGLSWRVAILPYIEQEQLYKQFKLDEPWDSAHNKKLIPLMPSIYASANAKPGFTFIQTFVGKKTINADPKKGGLLQKILDGTSNTLIFAEGAKAVEWTKPDDITVTDNDPIVLGGNPKFTLAAKADGSITQLPRNIDQKILRLLIDPADGTPIPDFEGAGPKPGVPMFKAPQKPRIPKTSEDIKPAAPGAKVDAGKQLPAPKVAKIARGKRGDVGGGGKLTANLANHDVVVIKLEGIPATVKGFEIIRGASFKAGGDSVSFTSVTGSPPGPVWVGAVVPSNAKSMTIMLPGNVPPFTVDLPAKVEEEVKAYD